LSHSTFRLAIREPECIVRNELLVYTLTDYIQVTQGKVYTSTVPLTRNNHPLEIIQKRNFLDPDPVTSLQHSLVLIFTNHSLEWKPQVLREVSFPRFECIPFIFHAREDSLNTLPLFPERIPTDTGIDFICNLNDIPLGIPALGMFYILNQQKKPLPIHPFYLA
jgi:hypothetical protein